jgi:hypothetical protein
MMRLRDASLLTIGGKPEFGLLDRTPEIEAVFLPEGSKIGCQY